MLNQLEDKHLLAVAMVSYVYYHPEPMSLIASENPCHDGKVHLPFWVNLESGTIVCRHRYHPDQMFNKPMVRLPDTTIPIRDLAAVCDMTLPSGRNEFVMSVLRYFINFWWSLEVDLEDIGLGNDSLESIRGHLLQPIYTPRGAQDAAMVLNNVIMPVLEEGRASQLLH